MLPQPQNLTRLPLIPNLPQAEVLITTPFHPGYLTRELVEKARPT